MKTRNGFVSNSSSTSFVVVLPEKLKFEDKEIQVAYNKLMADGEFEEFNNWGVFRLLSSELTKYAIGTFEVGSDSGKIVVADKNKVRKLLQIKE